MLISSANFNAVPVIEDGKSPSLDQTTWPFVPWLCSIPSRIVYHGSEKLKFLDFVWIFEAALMVNDSKHIGEVF